MKKNINYYSSDKLYQMKRKSTRRNFLITVVALVTVLLAILTTICFKESVSLGTEIGKVNYSENGNIDYKVYLKDNDYYEGSFLPNGMQYIASLIKTINVNFNYQIHSDKDMDYDYKYMVMGNLQITDRDDNTKVIYNKPEVLIDEKTIKVNDNNFVIDEDVDIDYDKYNNYVNAFKKDYGLTINSNLILTLEVSVDGKYDSLEEHLVKNSKLQISIPLSEQTLDIVMNTKELADSGSLNSNNVNFKINRPVIFGVFIVLALGTIALLVLDVYLYIKANKKDVYKAKVNKILKDYDRLIVGGKTDINEDKYENKIYLDNFEDMIDASQTLNVPILFYEVIPGEKCFFIVCKDDTLYKYRLTKAYLTKQKNINVQNNK